MARPLSSPPESPISLDPPDREYWGQRAIAARMGVHPRTIRAWHQRLLFPLITRGVCQGATFIGRRRGARVCFTTERLILRWLEQLALAQWRGRYEAKWRARREDPQEFPRQTVSGNS